MPCMGDCVQVVLSETLVESWGVPLDSKTSIRRELDVFNLMTVDGTVGAFDEWWWCDDVPL